MTDQPIPENQFQQPDVLAGLLGSFWSHAFDVDQLWAILRAAGDAMDQADQSRKEAEDSLSYMTVPVLERRFHYKLEIRRSRLQAYSDVAFFDGKFAFDQGLVYDSPAKGPWFVTPAPDGLVDLPVLADAIDEPNIILLDGVDFYLASGNILFRNDPFSQGLSQVPVIEDGKHVDDSVILWAHNSMWDKEFLQKFWGYVLGGKWKSTEPDKKMMQALLASLPRGVTLGGLLQAVEAITGCPFAVGGGETVEEIHYDRYGRVVATTAKVYRGTLSSNVLVAEGDVLLPGQAVIDAAQWYIPTDGDLPSWVKALVLGPELLPWCHGDLIFANKDVPLIVDEDHPSGYTYAEFEVGGDPAEVKEFFDRLHEVGVQQAKVADECDEDTIKVPGYPCDGIADLFYRRGTLAHKLDQRDNRIGEPTAANLPATINPARWLVQNVFRGRVLLLLLRDAAIAGPGLGLWATYLLSEFVPPWAGLFAIIELDSGREELSAGQDSLSSFDAAVPLNDPVRASQAAEYSTSKLVVS